MGRPDKPHEELHIRCDAGIHKRMMEFLDKFNEMYEPRLTKTKFIENAIELYLKEFKNMIEEK